MNDARAARQAARLRAALRERDARIQELEQRLIALESSTTVQVGRLVAGAARRPGRRTARLPRELYRLWRRRHDPAPSATRRESERLQLDQLDRPEDRLLKADPYTGFAVAGLFSPAGLAELDGTARVTPLYPHDAASVLEAADVDLLVVDAAAGAPGGPWAYLGVPGMYDREKALVNVLEIARSRNLPAVLWGESPPPALARLDWDLTVPSLGVDDLAERLGLTPVH
ncbi:hypothetical protein DPM19_14640 [Actinomadura craniellae]|uniref:Uncharacterized protein n=1 Tax=Actinomadura craniellae TaxID=2231787 RepID=A0A365H537_9ACTN|nr:hypothetical protein [Actinomadura craniellae]RAY14217.1 hypothetical protein DPM19_14640 [Actinomadura craniellae]